MLPLVIAGLLLLAPQEPSLAEQAAAARKARQQKTTQPAKDRNAPQAKQVYDNDALTPASAPPAAAGEAKLTPFQERQLSQFSRDLQGRSSLLGRAGPAQLSRMRDNLQRELEDVRAREMQAASPEEKNRLAAEALMLERKLQILHRKIAGTR